ncbi:hypothetical protein BH09PAT3_BH09PAT3_3280 [soil metagenome]
MTGEYRCPIDERTLCPNDSDDMNVVTCVAMTCTEGFVPSASDDEEQLARIPVGTKKVIDWMIEE